MDLNFLRIHESRAEAVLFGCASLVQTVASSFGPLPPYIGSQARNLGVIVDGDLKMDKWVSSVVKASFKHDFIKDRTLAEEKYLEKVLHTFMSVNYCDSLYVGISHPEVNRLWMLQLTS